MAEWTGWVTRPTRVGERRATGRPQFWLAQVRNPCLPGRPLFLSAWEGSDMGHLRLGEHIDAPIDHVWEIYASCERLPEWDMSIVEVKDCQGRLDRVGARVTTVARVFGRRIEGFRETTKADQPHDFAVKLVAGGAKATVDGTFTGARGGTDATFEVEYGLPMGMFAGVAEKLLGGSIERDLQSSMENLKALCESTLPARV